MANLTTSLAYQSGIPNEHIDAINAAIDEINLSGGDAMGDKVPSGTSNVASIKVGTVTCTAAKLTESATAGFLITGIVFSQAVEVSTAGASFVASTADATATTVTFTRGTSAAADTIHYVFYG